MSIIICKAKIALALFLAVIFIGGLSSTVRADAVTDWNALAVTRTGATGKAPPQQTRVFAMTHLAIHDALNAIDRRYEPYAFCAQGTADASPVAAVAAAAYFVLVNENPTQQANLDADYAAALLPIPNGPAKNNGIIIGRAAAYSIIALRTNDFSVEGATLPYPPGTQPGYWRPIGGQTPFGVGWGRVTPFAIRSGDQYRPKTPQAIILTTHQYADEYNEVKRIGCVGCPYPDLHNIARFWAPNVLNTWNRVARGASAANNLDLWENARLFALLNMSFADAAIVVWDAKFHYSFWRPQTAIQLGDTDGNPNTTGDPTWVSVLANPAYPDYSSGHSGLDGAFAETMIRFFGSDNYSFTETSGGFTRSFTSFSQAAQEGADSRVYGGIHFRTACEDALRQGQQVGRHVANHYLKAVHNDKD